MRDAMTMMSLLVACTLGCARVPATISAPTESPAPVSTAPVVSRPTPTSIDACRHVREVASKDQLLPSRLDELERDCVVALEQLRKQYDILASCLLDTRAATDVAECEQGMRNETNLLGHADPKPAGREVCSHLMDIMKREFGNGGVLPSDQELAKFEDDCVRDLAKERERIGAEKFDAQVACVMAATKMDELTQCDKE